MTIYTPSLNEKDKAKLLPEVVTESGHVPPKDAGIDIPGPRVVEITYFRRKGRSFYVHLLFALAVLGILACGALGAVVFYRHLHKTKQATYSGKCGTVYFDTTYHDSLKPPFNQQVRGQKVGNNQGMDFVEEDIVVEEEFYEELHTPAFDEVRESYVRHDFKMNYTAIVDHVFRQCFVMRLNRTAIPPPRTLIELLHLSTKAHAYLRRAEVIREDYEVSYAMRDMTRINHRVAKDCQDYPTHWLEKKVSGVFKRSVDAVQQEYEKDVVYAMMSNGLEKQFIYKLSIHNLVTASRIQT